MKLTRKPDAASITDDTSAETPVTSPADTNEASPTRLSRAARRAGVDTARTLLFVDDEPGILFLLKDSFDTLYNVRTAESGAEAIALIKSGFVPQVIVSDQRMPGMSGAEFLAASRALVPNAVRVALTGYADLSDVIASVNSGFIYRFMTKPWDSTEIVEAIRLCFEQYDIATRNDELIALNNEKNEFLGIAAHDLKNPLNAIMNMAEMMRSMSESIDETMRMEMLTHIVSSSERMFAIITNLLDVNALERGGIAFRFDAVNLVQQAELVADSYRARASDKGITIHFSSALARSTDKLDTPEATSDLVLADETATQQVLENLISNAVKYSPHNKNIFIEVSASAASTASTLASSGAESEGKPMLRVAVRDEGVGISADDQAKLFGKFARLSARPTGGEHSTGLGLSIVKKMVTIMNGRVWCESTLGEGATFFLELPRISSAEAASLQALRIQETPLMTAD
jgi:two-component system, sensor histidine kinase and response regulator